MYRERQQRRHEEESWLRQQVLINYRIVLVGHWSFLCSNCWLKQKRNDENYWWKRIIEWKNNATSISVFLAISSGQNHQHVSLWHFRLQMLNQEIKVRLIPLPIRIFYRSIRIRFVKCICWMLHDVRWSINNICWKKLNCIDWTMKFERRYACYTIFSVDLRGEFSRRTNARMVWKQAFDPLSSKL